MKYIRIPEGYMPISEYKVKRRQDQNYQEELRQRHMTEEQQRHAAAYARLQPALGALIAADFPGGVNVEVMSSATVFSYITARNRTLTLYNRYRDWGTYKLRDLTKGYVMGALADKQLHTFTLLKDTSVSRYILSDTNGELWHPEESRLNDRNALAVSRADLMPLDSLPTEWLEFIAAPLEARAALVGSTAVASAEVNRVAV